MIRSTASTTNHPPVARAPWGLTREIKRRELERVRELMVVNALAVEAGRLRECG
jgi:hypothetical protein